MRFSVAVRNYLGICGAAIALSSMLGSCGNTRQFTYMQGTFDTAKLSVVINAEPVIQKGDVLSVVIYSDNAAASAFYNQGVGGATTSPTAGAGGVSVTTSGTGSSGSAPGYLVDENGNIEFQGLGLLHVDGLSRTQLKELLDSKLKGELLTNPYYIIRFLNYKFTMLGELTKPGIYSIPGEHINLLEALGLAGDLTFYARRDNILVIREKDGKRQWGRMDITKPEIMGSPYFYLQPNDIVLVEASRKKDSGQ